MTEESNDGISKCKKRVLVDGISRINPFENLLEFVHEFAS
jgi:hypothetical protein